MGLLGKNIRERKRNAGNICFLVFLAFLGTTVILPLGAQDAFAVSGKQSSAASNMKLDLLRNDVKVENNQVKIYMLLKPITDQHFDSVYVDLSRVFNTTKTVLAGYNQVYDSIYGEVYGYAVNLVYDIPDGAEIRYNNKPAFIRNSEGKLVQVEFVKLEVEPPKKQPEATFTIQSKQNTFPVGQKVSFSINLDCKKAVQGAEFTLVYDSSYLQFADISPGAGIPETSVVHNKDGKITFAVGGDLAKKVNLAGVQFSVLKVGTTQLAFEQVSVVEENGGRLEELSAVGQNLTITCVKSNLKAKRHITVNAGRLLSGIDFNLILSDANNDNKVSLIDLVILADEYSGNNTGDYLKVGDS